MRKTAFGLITSNYNAYSLFVTEALVQKMYTPSLAIFHMLPYTVVWIAYYEKRASLKIITIASHRAWLFELRKILYMY